MSAGSTSKPAYRLRAGTALVAALFAGTGVAHATAAEAATPTLTHSAVARANPTPPQGLPSDWVQNGSGYFRTADSQDLLHYEVVLNAASLAVVDFRLQGFDRCLWGKTLVMPDGLGSSWDIHIDPSRGVYEDQNGLWANQVHNGQRLQLWKAGTLGWHYKVLEIGDLGALQPGTRVVFTWLKDSSSCGA